MHTPSHKSHRPASGDGGATPRTPRNQSGGGGGGGGGGSSSSSAAQARDAFFSGGSTNIHSMRAQKHGASKKAQSKTVFKPAMATPFQTPWNPLTLEQSHQALTELTNGLKAARSAAPSSAATPAVAASASSPAAPTAGGKRKRQAESSEGGDSTQLNPALPGVCIGINAVTRAATAGTLSMVLVCRSVSPVILIAHLPVVCQVARVPLITLNPQVTTRMLAQAIDDATRDTESEKEAAKDAKKPNAHSRRFQLCTTIGILRGHLESTVSSLSPLAAVPALPWLVGGLTSPPYESVRVLHTDAPEKKGGGKQKNQQKQQAAAAKKAAAAAAADTNNAQKTNANGETPAAPTATPAAPVGKVRIESATQRKKKQKQAAAAGASAMEM